MEATRRPFDTERPSHASFADRLARSEVSDSEDDARAPAGRPEPTDAAAEAADPSAEPVETTADASDRVELDASDDEAAPVATSTEPIDASAPPEPPTLAPTPVDTATPAPTSDGTAPELAPEFDVSATVIVSPVAHVAPSVNAAPTLPTTGVPAPNLATVAAPAAPARPGNADPSLATSASSEPAALEGDIGFVAPDELAAFTERINERPGESAHTEKPAPTSSENIALPQSTRELAPRAREVAPETPRFVGNDDTAAEILKQVRLKLSPELRQATLSLTPPDLGRISIRLSLEDRRLTAWVRGEKAETLDLLGKHLPELRATLAAHGIEAERFELSLGFQDRQRSHGEPRSAPHSSTSAAPVEALSETVALAPLARALAAANGVDTFA